MICFYVTKHTYTHLFIPTASSYIYLNIGGSTYKVIQASFGNSKINLNTIKSVVRVFDREGRVDKKKPTGRKRKYEGTHTHFCIFYYLFFDTTFKYIITSWLDIIPKTIRAIQDDDASLTLKEIREKIFDRADWYEHHIRMFRIFS